MKLSLLKYVDATVGQLGCFLLPSFRASGDFSFVKEGCRILLIRPGGIGDAVHLLPVIDLLRDVLQPGCLDVLAEKRNAGAFQMSPSLDQVYCYDGLTFWKRFAIHDYDLVIDTEQWHRLSAIVSRLIPSKQKIGFGTNNRRNMFSVSIEYSHCKREVDSFVDLIMPLNLGKSASEKPRLDISSSARKKANVRLGGQNGPVVVLFPGASIRERQWGVDRFSSLATKVTELGGCIVVVGGNAEKNQGDTIGNCCSGLNLAGQTSLEETAAVLDRADVLVSGDSGVLHLACSLDVPTVSLFGPGISDKWAPRGEKHIVINHQLDCSPCTQYGYTPQCRIGAPCIREITVEEVFSAVKNQITRVGKG